MIADEDADQTNDPTTFVPAHPPVKTNSTDMVPPAAMVHADRLGKQLAKLGHEA